MQRYSADDCEVEEVPGCTPPQFGVMIEPDHMAEKDLYSVLGVSRDASPETIREAYRRLARQHHPDINTTDSATEHNFTDIQQAYEVLSNPEERSKYDARTANASGGRASMSGGVTGTGLVKVEVADPIPGQGVELASRLTRRRNRIAFLVRYGLFLAVLTEIGSRAFLAATAGVSMLRPGEMVHVYYPQLKEIQRQPPAQNDGTFDVLLLGGSVIDRRWTEIDALLRSKLSARLGRPVRTYNLGAQAHTSRDSFFKYRHLRDIPFDLVVVYHGINEARLNHCPDAMFRADYAHYRWYAQVNAVEAHREIGILATPYVLGRVIAALRGRLSNVQYAPEGSPPAEWHAFGTNVKTRNSFRDHLTQIVELAREKNETVILNSFANYVAPGYSAERFKQRELDYDRHQTPIEVWGTPEGVVAGIAAHNEIVEQLAAQYDNALFVDQARRMPAGAKHFQDICHLTRAGSEAFVDHLLEVLIPALQPQPPGSSPGEPGTSSP